MMPQSTIPPGSEIQLPLELVFGGAGVSDTQWSSQSLLNVRERLLASAGMSFVCVLLWAGEHVGSRAPRLTRGRHPL
jgi:hypothetical protein